MNDSVLNCDDCKNENGCVFQLVFSFFMLNSDYNNTFSLLSFSSSPPFYRIIRQIYVQPLICALSRKTALLYWIQFIHPYFFLHLAILVISSDISSVIANFSFFVIHSATNNKSTKKNELLFNSKIRPLLWRILLFTKQMFFWGCPSQEQ